MSVMESGKTYMKTREFRTTVLLTKVLGLKPGMVICIEPMINEGTRYVKTLSDNWTVVTGDSQWCAHFEHPVAITETGYEILATL